MERETDSTKEIRKKPLRPSQHTATLQDQPLSVRLQFPMIVALCADHLQEILAYAFTVIEIAPLTISTAPTSPLTGLRSGFVPGVTLTKKLPVPRLQFNTQYSMRMGLGTMVVHGRNFLDKRKEAQCHEKPWRSPSSNHTAPNYLADQKHCASDGIFR